MSYSSLWALSCTTDPRHTKEFKRGGGFSGTAINPTYLLMKATEIFGPVGMGWGWEIEKEDYVPGAAFVIEGQVTHEVNHVVRLALWYRITPDFVKLMPEAEAFLGQTCKVVHFGQTAFVGKNKFGAFTDEEAPKKSLTDAISKCLVCLGFSADIHLGLYDSNKYVNDRKAEFKGEKTAAPKATPANKAAANDSPPRTLINEDTGTVIVKHLNEVIQTVPDLTAYWKDIVEQFGITKEAAPDENAHWRCVFAERSAKIKQATAQAA